MMKIVFLFALAFLALQGSNALPRRDLNKNNAQELITELKDLIRLTSSRFDQLFTDVKEKVKDIENESNIHGLFAEFKQSVDEMIIEDVTHACETVAHQQLREVQKIAAQFSCQFEIDEQINVLRKQLKSLVSRIGALFQVINHDVAKCLVEAHGNQDQFNRCLNNELVDIKEQVEAMKNEVEKFFQVFEDSVLVFTDKISTCVADKKEKLVSKIQEAEKVIQTCVNENDLLFSKNSFDSPSFVEELIVELKGLFKLTASRFGDFFTEVRHIVEEIEKKANIAVLLDEFEQHIVNLETEDVSHACKTIAKEQVSEVQKLVAIFSCEFEIDEQETDLKNQLQVLEAKLRDLLQEINRDALKCLKENHNNFTKCMNAKYDSIKQKVDALKKEIEETFNVVEDSVPVFTDKIFTCVADKKEKLVSKIQEAEKTIQTCVNKNDLIFN